MIAAPADKIIPFPSTLSWDDPTRAVRHGRTRIHRAALLPGFRVVGAEERRLGVRAVSERAIDRGLQLNFDAAPLVIEFDDPLSVGKRNINIWFLEHNGERWKTIWMDRSQVKNKVRYGLRRG